MWNTWGTTPLNLREREAGNGQIAWPSLKKVERQLDAHFEAERIQLVQALYKEQEEKKIRLQKKICGDCEILS